MFNSYNENKDMKTKNIFRMLLVAAALLMGANNAKAETRTTIFSANNPELGNYVSFDYGVFDDAQANDQLIVTYTPNLPQGWTPVYKINFNDVIKETVDASGTVVLTLTSDAINSLNTSNPNNRSAFIQGEQIAITQVVLVTYGGTQTTTYSITIDNNIQHGTVSVSGGKTTGLTANETVTLTATPASGYELSAWDVKDASNNDITVTNNQFSMPASNVTVSATFTPSYSVPEGAERHNLTFETQEYCAATWDSNNKTFTWGNRDGWNTAWTFMAAQNISGDLSNWTHLHLNVSYWNNASAKQLRVVFKEADGNVPSNGDTKEFVVSPNASGNIDLNLVGVNWGNCEIKDIYDLTIYGCARDDENQAASVLVTEAYYVTATVSETYTVSVSAGSNGSASVDKSSAAVGETVTVTTNPNSGYEVDAVTVDNVAVTKDANVDNRYTFTMPGNNVTVNVSFKAIKYTVSVNAGSNGSASVDKTSAAANETVTVTTNPNSGYEVDAVTVDNVTVTKDANVDNRYTFTMPGNDVTVNVSFKAVQQQSPSYAINYTISGTAHGGFVSNNPASATVGSTVTFGIAVDEGYNADVYATFGDNNTALTLTPGANGQYSFTMPDGEVNVTLSFTEIVTINRTIGTYGAITFSSEVPVTIPEGVTAYYAKEVSNNKVVMIQIMGIIPSQTGVVLFGNAGTYTFTQASSAGQTITGNLLRPVLNQNGYNCISANEYVLTWHDHLVFAQTSSENYAEVHYGQAYLDLTGVNVNAGSRLRISFKHDDDDLTGIQSLQSDERSLDGAVYNLRGQRVEHPTKGIYIINGKKVVIK